jgi:DNA-binding transcriptional ArsR family regulator
VSSPPARPADEAVIRSAAQFKALGHPVRHGLVNLLRQRPATLRQLGESLGLAKGTVAHHVQVLRDAGLVDVAETRHVRGGTELYFALVSAAFRHEGSRGARLLFEAALSEMADPEPETPEHTTLRHVWLPPGAAAALAAQLEACGTGIESARTADARPYGVLLSLFPTGTPRLPEDDGQDG